MSAYKKLLAGVIAFGFIIGIFSAPVSQAGIIAVGVISADATVGGINNNFVVITDAINGNIQGSATTGSSTNILAGSIGVLDLGAEASPVVFANETLGIGDDTTTSQTAFVYSGLTPATSVTLTSDISAGTAYINGYRVVKSATSQTYAASMDTYVDLSQTGVYTLSPVSVGGAAPAVAGNSARLAKVTTSGTAITSVTDLANRRIPGLIIPSHYRTGLVVSRDSTSTLTVLPGTCEINNMMVNKISTTTLNLATAGDWAGGSSLRATSTAGYVGLDSNGNLKLSTTAPAFDNYGVSTVFGKKRYNTWAGTVYRVLGWFYMNATGSGELNTYEVGNIKEGDVSNKVNFTDSSLRPLNSTSLADVTNTTIHYYSSGNPVTYMANISGDTAGAIDAIRLGHNFDGTDIQTSYKSDGEDNAGYQNSFANIWMDSPGQGQHTYKLRYSVSTSTWNVRNSTYILQED